MSSEGSDTISSGSRIRQFGLYRTIDARTEEFLRLSRKRQIKQGCACAAVSTAITVTVVISVLLVYEYSINAGSNSSKILTLKSNWYGLLNETSDGNALDKKFAQKKMNFDSATLKLLPLILKALNQNRYLEKIIDDYSSSSPSYEKKESTEFKYKKDIFVNERWSKMPSSRLYTLVYKTSPLVTYKSPTTTSEYYTKNRKIRDYKRILNYFDKMISEKVKTSSSLSIDKINNMPPEKVNLKAITKPMQKHVIKTTTSKMPTPKKAISKVNKDRALCKCPKNIGDLLQKVMSSIKLMMLDNETSKSPCEEVTKSEPLNFYPLDKSIKDVFPMNSINEKPLANAKLKIPPQTKPNAIPKIPTASKNKQGKKINPLFRMQPWLKQSIFETNTVDYPLLSDNSMYKPQNKGYALEKLNINDDNAIMSTESNIVTSTTSIKDSIKNSDIEMTSTPALILTVPTRSKEDKLNLQAVNENWLQNNATKQNSKTDKPLTVFSNNEYDDYFSSTPTGSNDTEIDFENLDVHSVELVKSKILSERRKSTNQSSIEIQPINPTDYDINDNTNSSLYFIDKMVTVIFPTLQSKIHNDSIEKVKSVNASENIPRHIHNITKIKTKALNKTSHVDYQHESSVPEEEVDKVVPDEELQEAEATKQRFTMKNNTSGVEKPINLHDILQITGESKKYTSMLPMDRPVYLEVNRNDWRHDEHQDYDINLNNNNFDLSRLVK